MFRLECPFFRLSAGQKIALDGRYVFCITAAELSLRYILKKVGSVLQSASGTMAT